MNFYEIHMGSGLAIDQPTLTQTLTGLGADCIQTSSGLFLASDQNESDLRAALAGLDRTNTLTLKPVDVNHSADFTPDMKNLIQKHQ